ncbi:hypothetical protein FQA39_LY15840 [Lamprigera yunnana]|nr:hypothetical protein FQA39_LY15840 [Lamprigera yunnana]
MLFLLMTIMAVAKGTMFESKIVGGADAGEGQYPFIVSIRYFGSAEHVCAGSIISQEWVVTAAHCVDKISPQDLKIVAGTNHLTHGGVVYDVEEIIVHEKYDSYYVKNDVALLKIAPITYTNSVASVVLDRDFIDEEVRCILSGWGMRKYPGPVTNRLQHLNLTTTTLNYCQSIMTPIDKSQICTLTTPTKGGCRFDSGGPLIRRHSNSFKQIGIVSWMILCAKGYPDVYTRVSHYHPWFKNKCNCL